MTQQQLEQFDCTGYQRILISYSVDSFIHGSSAQKLRFLQTGTVLGACGSITCAAGGAITGEKIFSCPSTDRCS